MISYEPDFRPSLDDSPSWDGTFEPFNGVKNLRESKPIPSPPDMTSSFDDTFRPRLKESNDPHNFNRGVPTNDASSSQNYDPDHVKIIDGEHQTLLSVGEICEADEGDDDTQHLAQHRLQLANPKLNEAQRRNLMKHIESHYKSKKKKAKTLEEHSTGPNLPGPGPYKKGLGIMSRAKPAVTDSKIPQDSQVSNERKRTSGVMSMESRMKSFDAATRRSYGRRY